MATIRLFDNEPYKTKAQGKVLSCAFTVLNGRECYACVLDQTIFFPEEGGQTPDWGKIAGLEVLDVQVKDRVITHYLPIALEVGTEVAMELDWKHRFSHMQQHSGEHIFSGTVHRMFGFDNVGFHLSENSVTMDFNGVLSETDLELVEQKVNEAIAENIQIIAEYVDSDTLSTLEYRSKKELEGPVRIVTIPGYDVCACCAPHVKRTGEIGMLKIVHAMNYKGGVRVNILCGFRALDYYRESLKLIDSLTDFMTTGRENVLEHVKKLKNENYELNGKLRETRQKLLMQELNNIPENLDDVVFFCEKMENTVIRNAVNELTAKHSGVVAFFSGSDQDGYSYILASQNKDTREIQKKLAECFGAKGGGKPEMVCGSLKAAEVDIREKICIVQ